MCRWEQIAELEGRIDHVQTAARKVNETVTLQAEETVVAVNALMDELIEKTQKQIDDKQIEMDQQTAQHQKEQVSVSDSWRVAWWHP
jgi:hypothetical protein